MDPVSAIVGALIAGATAAASDVATDAVKDAYKALKTLLTDTYKLASTTFLDKKPASPVAQEAVKEEIRDTPAILEDQDVLERAKVLQEAVSALSDEKLTALGIDIEKLKAGGNIIAERIHGGIKGKDWVAEGDVRFSDVTAGGASSGN